MRSNTNNFIQIFTIEDYNQLLVLKQKSSLVNLPLSPYSKNAINNMLEVLKSKNKGVGLAASQIGINERIIICSFTGKIEDFEIMINPSCVKDGNTIEEGWEGCFSIPLTFAKVSRWKDISVSYYTEEGSIINKSLNGFAARVYQHELDHLEGILMTEKSSEIKKFNSQEEFNLFLQMVRKERGNKV